MTNELTKGIWINTKNGHEYVVTEVSRGDVFVARVDGSDARMVMQEKFERYFVRGGKVCGYHDGCPPDAPACHLCNHLQ